jgi:hypothetical protein
MSSPSRNNITVNRTLSVRFTSKLVNLVKKYIAANVDRPLLLLSTGKQSVIYSVGDDGKTSIKVYRSSFASAQSSIVYEGGFFRWHLGHVEVANHFRLAFIGGRLRYLSDINMGEDEILMKVVLFLS